MNKRRKMGITYAEEIAGAFLGNITNIVIKPYGNGHIHDTYLLEETKNGKQFILQRINKQVFKNPDILVSNHLKLSVHFSAENIPDYQIPKIYPVQNSIDYLYYDPDGGPWRLMEFINESYAMDILPEISYAEEAGSAYGWFLAFTHQLKPSDFTLSIPDFHSIKLRNEQFDEALRQNEAGRKAKCLDLINYFQERKTVFEKLESLANNEEIPFRLTHNDTKINNILFRDKKAIAVIDLDTVGPGIVFYDYGDSLRTIANYSLEDEKDLNKTGFNKDAFKAYSEGFLKHTANILSENELYFLHLAPQMMTYLIGIRFLTDYLNGDKYYKTHYPEHNLVRALVQKVLLENMESKNEFIKSTILSIVEKYLVK